MIAVRVLRPFGLWNAGELAGFPPERAQQLIESGFAELVKPPQPEAPVAAPPRRGRPPSAGSA